MPSRERPRGVVERALVNGAPARPASPRRTRPKNRRQVILQRAATLFARTGYEGTSISDIARAVGISKPALYHHYKDKDDIYASIIVTVLEAMCLAAEDAARARTGARDGLRRIMETHAAFMDHSYDSFIAAQLGFRGLREPPRRAAAIYWRDRYEGLIRSVIAEGVRSGELRSVDTRTAAWAALSCLNWMARWYDPRGAHRAAHFARAYCEILLDGLAAGPPRRRPPRRGRVEAGLPPPLAR